MAQRKKLGISTKPKSEPVVQGNPLPKQVPGPASASEPQVEEDEGEVTAGVLNDEEQSVSAIKSNIEEWVRNIGTSVLPETVMPRPKNRNNGDEASAYIEAEIILKAAEERFKEAKEAADKVGVFGDRAEYKEGETRMVYQTPAYVISVKVGKSSKAINKERVEETLSKYLAKDKVADALDECMKPRSAPVQFISALK